MKGSPLPAAAETDSGAEGDILKALADLAAQPHAPIDRSIDPPLTMPVIAASAPVSPPDVPAFLAGPTVAAPPAEPSAPTLGQVSSEAEPATEPSIPPLAAAGSVETPLPPSPAVAYDEPAPPVVTAPSVPPVSIPAKNTEITTMVPWITTKQFTVDLFPSWTKTEGDKEWSLGAVTVNVPEITAKLDQLIADLNEDQWEIKMVVPLDKSLTYHEHQKVVRQGNRREPEAVLGAFGLGWAGGTTSSLLVVCQRTEWLEPSEYKARIDARRYKLDAEERRRERALIQEQNMGVNAKITAAQKLLSDLKTNGVEIRKSGFLRGEKFVVGGVEFSNRTEAESALAARLGEVEADLAALPKQLKPMPPEL
ncbi:hypothetical protein E8L99_13960 [Phreatobacter aquaticus]|uniref:Uncharacterized protein n=1 Tax=Phreatobacter aquaticus TaxID=2570229 RepID=A0A4D7QFT1_9HYPH|nr:hypothetical protein [Phreatobacter aquaticus]QCK86780.1 hypothetical protein E8L99_13960 [Phreatobacter aquaticus]